MLGPDTIIEEEKRLAALVFEAFSVNDSISETVSGQETIETQKANKNVHVDPKILKKKRKSRETKEAGSEDEDEEAKRERKRRKKEEKGRSGHALEKGHKKEKHKEKAEDAEANFCALGKSSPQPISQKNQKIEDVSVIEKNRFSGNATYDDAERLADHKRREKQEKKRLKKLQKFVKAAENLKTHSLPGKHAKPEKFATVPGVLDELKKRKEKRKDAT